MNRTTYHLQVTIHADDGTIFYTNDAAQENPEPNLLAVELGMGQIFPKVEDVLPQMELGETMTFDLSPEDAFGDYDEDNIQRIDLSEIPGVAHKAGQELLVELVESGEEVPARIHAIDGDEAELDFNHPLAGRCVRLDVMLVSSEEAPLDA